MKTALIVLLIAISGTVCGQNKIKIEDSGPQSRRPAARPLDVTPLSDEGRNKPLTVNEQKILKVGGQDDASSDRLTTSPGRVGRSISIEDVRPGGTPRTSVTPETRNPEVSLPASGAQSSQVQPTPKPAAEVQTQPKEESRVETDKDNMKSSVSSEILPEVKIKLGDEVLFQDPKFIAMIEGKRVGLVTNPSGMDSKFVSTIDKLASNPLCKLTALFAPEHGIRGAETAGEAVKSGVDPITSVPVYSLHGKDGNKPKPEQMETLDVLIFDIQDIGNRSYTYPGTMRVCMEAAKEAGKKFMVLDRPNPLGGELVDGNIPDPKFLSLVNWGPVAFLYGLTIGEVAMYMNEKMGIGCDLTVVPMSGWKRSMKWWDTGLPWVPTSTHMQHATACWHIAITGTFGELHGVNEGVGYPAPFEYVGAPWIDSIRLANELNSRKLPGLYFRPVYYKPFYHIYKDEQCGGVQVLILDYDKCQPVEAGMHILEAVQKLFPQGDVLHKDDQTSTAQSRVKMFNKVMGTEEIRNGILAGKSATEIIESWKSAREQYREERKKYFLYQ